MMKRLIFFSLFAVSFIEEQAFSAQRHNAQTSNYDQTNCIGYTVAGKRQDNISIGELASKKNIDLISVSLSDEYSVNLFVKAIQKQDHLESISIAWNACIKDAYLTTLQKTLKTLSNLRKLKFICQNCGLSQAKMIIYTFEEVISSLPNLTEVYFSDNFTRLQEYMRLRELAFANDLRINSTSIVYRRAGFPQYLSVGSLSNLLIEPNIEEFRIMNGSESATCTLLSILNRHSNLQSITMFACNISTITMLNVRTLVRQLPILSELNIIARRNNNIAMFIIQSLIEDIRIKPNLTLVNMELPFAQYVTPLAYKKLYNTSRVVPNRIILLTDSDCNKSTIEISTSPATSPTPKTEWKIPAPGAQNSWRKTQPTTSQLRGTNTPPATVSHLDSGENNTLPRDPAWNITAFNGFFSSIHERHLYSIDTNQSDEDSTTPETQSEPFVFESFFDSCFE